MERKAPTWRTSVNRQTAPLRATTADRIHARLVRLLAGVGSAMLLLGVLAPDASAARSPVGRHDAAAGGGSLHWNGALYREIIRTVARNAPRFPARTCDVTAARYAHLVTPVTDGAGTSDPVRVWYYGDAINAAIRNCHDAGGGTVVVPARGSRNGGGVYYSGAITLLSNVNLHVATGATIRFVRDFTNTYYPVVLTSYQGIDLYDYSPLIYALNQTNLAVTGGGTLDAQYNVTSWRPPASLPGATQGTWQVLSDMNDENLPVVDRIFTDNGHMPAAIPVVTGCPPRSRDWGPCRTVRYMTPPAGAVAYQSTFVPQFVEFNHSSRILVQGIHLVNTQFWEIHPLNSIDITIRHVTIDDTAHHTDDGIDPESCKDVVLTDNNITVLDDGIAVKSGRNQDGRLLRAPSEDIIISGNHFTNPAGGGSAAFSIGSEMSGGVTDVFAQNNVATGAGLAYMLKFKTNAYRGGAISDVYLRNSTIDQTIRGLVRFDTGYNESPAQPDGDVFNPTIRNVYIDNVNAAPTVSTAYPALIPSLTVSRSPVRNVLYENSTFYTTSTLQAAFQGETNEFFANLRIRNVRFINPMTHTVQIYNSTPLTLADATVAHVGSSAVRLTPAGTYRAPVTSLPGDTFTVTGRIPDYRRRTPTVQVFIDRDPTPVGVTVESDGAFQTDPITVDNNQYWYRGVHYLSINLHNGIDVNTIVYDVTTG